MAEDGGEVGEVFQRIPLSWFNIALVFKKIAISAQAVNWPNVHLQIEG